MKLNAPSLRLAAGIRPPVFPTLLLLLSNVDTVVIVAVTNDAHMSPTPDHVSGTINWALRHPDVMAWLEEHMESDTFAASLAQHIDRRGHLTDGQIAAVRNSITRENGRTPAPSVSAAVIEARFSTARENLIKKPSMRLDTFIFKSAGDTGRNPGAIYVTEDGQYLGKVMAGKFLKTAECSDDQQSRILAAVSNPDEAAKAYGQRTGNCSVCGRELTAEESIERFVGPICLGKYGLIAS